LLRKCCRDDGTSLRLGLFNWIQSHVCADDVKEAANRQSRSSQKQEAASSNGLDLANVAVGRGGRRSEQGCKNRTRELSIGRGELDSLQSKRLGAADHKGII
jgi:hypothetical protein